MWSMLLKLAAPFATPLLIAAGLAVGTAGMAAYDRWIDDPAVARAARTDFVHKSEKVALEAQLDLERRTIAGYQLSILDYQNKLEAVRQMNAAEDERIAQENAEYEAELKADGRHRGLTDADIQWLRQP